MIGFKIEMPLAKLYEYYKAQWIDSHKAVVHKPVVLHLTKARQNQLRELKDSSNLLTWLYLPKKILLEYNRVINCLPAKSRVDFYKGHKT